MQGEFRCTLVISGKHVAHVNSTDFLEMLLERFISYALVEGNRWK
jgi:hypothetical protein